MTPTPRLAIAQLRRWFSGKNIHDWLWWNIGWHFWVRSARNHPSAEVKRRLGWMTLDCVENASTSAGVEWRRKNIAKNQEWR